MANPSLWSTKTLRAAPAKKRLCRPSAWQPPPNCWRFHDNLYQIHFSGCSALHKSRRKSLPHPYSHSEPLPFSEWAETGSRQIIHISIRVLGWGSRAPLCQICRQIVDWHHWGPPQAIACGPHVRQGIHYYSLIVIISPQSGSPPSWSWFSIRVEKVGVAPSGLGARAVRKCSLECHGFRRTASLKTTSNRTTSRRTTSARKTSRLELIECLHRQPITNNTMYMHCMFAQTTHYKQHNAYAL